MKKIAFLFMVLLTISACGTKKNLYKTSFNQDMFECRGTEPFWAISMEPDAIIYSEPGTEKLYFPYQDPIEQEKGTLVFKTYIQEGNKSTRLQIILTKEECSDGMSDTVYPYTAEVELDGKPLKGCAK